MKINKLFSIQNKVCVITGGAGGIGNIIAKSIFDNRGKVIILDRKKIKKNKKNFEFIQCDLTNIEEQKKVIKYLKIKYKKIDAVINACGVSDEGSYINNINTNLNAIYEITKNIIPLMRKNSSVVNITSLNAEMGFSNNPGYNSSKGALKMLTKSFCVDYSYKGIRFNNIGPGYFRTSMTKKNFQNKKKRQQRLQRIPMSRYGDPQELVGATIFLISNGSSYITGQDIYVDGGFLAKGI